jgi:hypothetical protein
MTRLNVFTGLSTYVKHFKENTFEPSTLWMLIKTPTSELHPQLWFFETQYYCVV